jgi:hypothetical protein
MGLGKHVGARKPVARADEGVPQPGAVVSGIPAVVGAVGDPARADAVGGNATAGAGLGGLGCRQRPQHLLDQRRVLDGAPSGQPNAADAVLGDREVPAEVGGALLAAQRPLVAAFGAVGVEPLEHVRAGTGQLGGITRRGLVDQDALGGDSKRRIDR